MKFKVVSSLEEMARVGFFNDMEVIVFTDDPGKIPHFHIRDSTTHGDIFNCCIRIDKPEYFKHTGKEDILNSKDKKDLMSFLSNNSESKKFSNLTNWEVLVELWNMNNSDTILPDNIVMPDYNNL